MDTVQLVRNMLLSSGSAWVLWLLGVLSMISVAIIVERWLFFRLRSTDLEVLARGLDKTLRAGAFAEAIRELSASPATAAQIAAAGLGLADRGPKAADRAMQSAVALERGKLERWLAYLGTVGNNAPFVGLFGTVIGVIHAFDALGHGSAMGKSGAAASQAVMSSVAEALVATAVGILVALPAVAAYNYYQRRVASMLGASEVLSNLVLAYLVDQEEG